MTESNKKSGTKGSSNADKKSETSTETTPSKQSGDENMDITKPSNNSSVAANDPAMTNNQPAQVNAGSGRGFGVLALIISLVALAGAGYSWYQTAVNARIAGGAQVNRLAAVEQQFGTVKEAQSGVSDQISKIRQRVADTETGVADQVSQVKQLVSSTESALVTQLSDIKQQIVKSEGSIGTQIREIRTEAETQQKQVATEVASSQQGIEQQASAFRSEFDTLAQSIGELKNELGTSVDGWSLREVEHLLVMANQQLQLGQDAVVARQALQIADARLQHIDNPSLMQTRQALSQEIAALDQIKPIDYEGITNSISLLSNTLENLPISGVGDVTGPNMSANAVAGGDDNGAQDSSSTTDKITSIGKSFLADLGGLVQVEKGGKPVAPSITPEIAQMTLTRGRLILEGAQVALMRQQPGVYLDRLNAAEAWVSEKFDTSNDQTAGWLSQLSALKDVSLQVENPDISGSLATLRKIIGTEG